MKSGSHRLVVRRSASRRGAVTFVTAMLVLVEPALADQWKVTLKDVTIARTKPNGQPWDADNSPPDVMGRLSVGRLDGERCPPRQTEVIRKHQDSFQFADDISIVADGDLADMCFSVALVDRDLVDDDPIGAGAGPLRTGESRMSIGAATIRLLVESTATGMTDRPPPKLASPPPPRAALYKVSLVAARIHATKADGSTWDEPTDKEAEDARLARSLLNVTFAGVTGGAGAIIRGLLGGEDGTKTTYKAQTVSAPDPRVVIRWGSIVLATPKVKNTFNPKWDFEFIVPADVAEHKPVRIEVFDEDDGDDDPIGADSISGREMVSGDVLKRSFGAVEEIVFEVEKTAEAAAPVEKTINVDTTRGWVDTGVVLVAGQTIQVTATGEHCRPGGHVCMSPDGGGGIAFEAPEHESGKIPPVHDGQLAAVIGHEVFPVGAAASLTARTSGRLLLGVASKVSTGALTATVRIFYPLRNE
jgi:hypothetical protein